MRILGAILIFLFVQTLQGQTTDSFWSGTTTPSQPIGKHSSFSSQVAGVYGMRPLESINLGKPTDLKSQKTEFEKLIDQGVKELGSLARQELKNYVKREVTKAVSKELGKEFGKEMGNQAGALVGSIMNDMAEAKARREAEEAERQRLWQLEQDRLRRLTIKKSLRSEFLTTLVDGKMPIVAPQPENFFFIINQETDSTLSVSLFNVFANASNQLPYKVEMIKAYQNEIKSTKSWLYGPFKTTKEAQTKINDLAIDAFTGFFELEVDKFYVHGGQQGSNAPQTQVDDGDFWGTGNKTNTTTTSDDFWGVKKKN